MFFSKSDSDEFEEKSPNEKDITKFLREKKKVWEDVDDFLLTIPRDWLKLVDWDALEIKKCTSIKHNEQEYVERELTGIKPSYIPWTSIDIYTLFLCDFETDKEAEYGPIKTLSRLQERLPDQTLRVLETYTDLRYYFFEGMTDLNILRFYAFLDSCTLATYLPEDLVLRDRVSENILGHKYNFKKMLRWYEIVR
jgi:hypothetical protein